MRAVNGNVCSDRIYPVSKPDGRIFVPQYVFHVSFAERLKPLATCVGGRIIDVCSDRIYPVSKPDGTLIIRFMLFFHASFAERLKPLTTCDGGR